MSIWPSKRDPRDPTPAILIHLLSNESVIGSSSNAIMWSCRWMSEGANARRWWCWWALDGSRTMCSCQTTAGLERLLCGGVDLPCSSAQLIWTEYYVINTRIKWQLAPKERVKLSRRCGRAEASQMYLNSCVFEEMMMFLLLGLKKLLPVAHIS